MTPEKPCCEDCVVRQIDHLKGVQVEKCTWPSCECHTISTLANNALKDYEQTFKDLGKEESWEDRVKRRFHELTDNEQVSVNVMASVLMLVGEEIVCALDEGYKEGVKDGEGTKNGVQRYQLGYDDGAAEATMVCNEKTIPLAIEEERQRVVEIAEKVSDYAEHLDSCIQSFFEEGRPTENGGYEQKFRGVWYLSSPIDKTPKCDCGLDDLLTTLLDNKKEI